MSMAEDLCFAGPMKLQQILQGPNLNPELLPPGGAKAEKALLVVEVRQTSFVHQTMLVD